MEKTINNNIIYILKNTYNKDKKIIFYLFIFTIITTVAPFIEILFPKVILDSLTDQEEFNIIIIIIIGFISINFLLKFLIEFITARYSIRLINMRFIYVSELQNKCMSMEYKNTESPEILNQIENASTSVQSNHQGIEGVMHKLFEIFGMFFSIIGYCALIFTLNPLIIVFLTINVLLLYYKSLNNKKYEVKNREELSFVGRKYSYIFDVMSNFLYGKDIRIFRIDKLLLKKIKESGKDKIDLISKLNDKNFKLSVLECIMSFFREGIIYFYLAYRVIFTDMTIGNFMMYFTTVSTFTNTLQQLLYAFSEVKAENIYLQHYRDFMETIDSTGGIKEFKEFKEENEYEIEFENVYFKYPNSDSYIFKDLSFVIKSGEKVALIGVNGSGKTTLIKLLTRLYEPNKGKIKINGIDIREYKKDEYYKIFQVVFQDIKIVAASIGENITISNDIDKNKDEIMKVITEVGLSDRISSLTKGVYTPLLKIFSNDGIELSGGENQKLGLARALYKGGGVVILDEPTSALDPVAEYNVYSSFNKIINKKTAIFVSHRLASTRFCDKIFFFENGEINEMGTHEQLLNKGGKYKEMFDIQSKYYKDIEENVVDV